MSEFKFIGVLCKTKHGLLIPKKPVQVLQDVMEEGLKKHGVDDWETQPEGYYAGRAYDHLKNWCGGVEEEDHLAHAFTDLALEIALREKL